MSPCTIEPARPGDPPALPVIERAAAALFAGWPVPLGVLEQTTSLAELEAARRGGRLWVARSQDGVVVGFAQVELVGGEPHLEEMDVLPSHGRRGIGRLLIGAVQAWARDAGYAALTLTTFRDVPWNAPFYASCGFRALDDPGGASRRGRGGGGPWPRSRDAGGDALGCFAPGLRVNGEFLAPRHGTSLAPLPPVRSGPTPIHEEPPWSIRAPTRSPSAS